MFRILAALCLVGSACGFTVEPWMSGLKGPWMPGFKVKYDMNVFQKGHGENLFDLPLSNRSAYHQGFLKMNRPLLPDGYCGLELWCRKEDKFRVCIYTDETNDVAGVQVNIPCDEFKPTYDMKEQGFIIWTTALDNKIVKFYAFLQFFVSPYVEKRIHSKDTTIVLRDPELHYSGFNGKLANVATEQKKLDKIFTKQNCVKWMGQHYYYNMNKHLECSGSTLSPFSTLFYSNKLVGTTISFFGHFHKDSKYKGEENMTGISAKFAVPHGPTCMYNDIANYGGVSITIFYINSPWQISCKLK